LATTNKNFKVKNGLDVNGPIGVGSTPSYGSTGQVLTSQGTGSVPIWTTVSSSGLTATDYVVTGKLSSDQTITSNTNDVLISFVDDFDPQNWWDATTKHFTPTTAGYYNVALHVWWTAAAATTNQYNVQIRKNSNTSAIFQNQTVTGSGSSQGGSRLIYLNGTTDYIDFTAYNGDASTRSLQWGGAGQGTWFSAALMTAGKGDQGDPGDPGAGVASGGTAGQILSKVDGTDYNTTWIDQTSLSSSTVKHQVKLGEAIAKGQAVYVSTATGANMIVSKASNATEATSSKTMGLLETGGVLNDQVNVITEGLLDNVNVGSASAGDPVWLGTSGNLIYGLTNKPIAPAHLVFIGIVTKEGTAGRIFVRIQNGFELNEIHNVLIGTDYTANSIPGDNELLAYNSASSLWINQTAEEAGVANLSGATFTGNVAGTNANLSGNVNAVTVNATTLIGNTNASTITTGTIPSGILGNSTVYVGTTAVALNRTTASQTLTGVSIDGSAAQISTTANTGSGVGYLTFVSSNTSSTQTVYTDTGLRWSPLTNALSAGYLTASSNVTAGENVSAVNFVNNNAQLNVISTAYPMLLQAVDGITLSGPVTAANTVTISGTAQLGLSETQKVVNVRTPTDYYTLANNTYTINLASGNYFSNITTQRLYNSSSGWTIVGTNTYSTNATATSPLTYNLISSGSTAQGDVAIVIATTDSATNALPTVNLTASPGWTTNAASSTTQGSAVFYKTLGATPDTTIVLNYGATDYAAVSSIVIRSSDILPVYVSAIATPGRTEVGSGIATPPATITTIANTLVVTAVSLKNDIVNVATSTGPTGYSNFTLATSHNNVAGTAAASALATKFVATVGTETPTTYGLKFANSAAVSDASDAWTFQVAAYLDPTITLSNSATGTYPASTYVLHINNSPSTTTTWSGQTFRWQSNTAPTLSSAAGLSNNIVILETIDGSTFRGAVLNSYA